MGAMTDFLANKLRDHTLRNIAYSGPTTVHLALFSTVTTEAGGGTEVTGGSYARQAITFAAGTSAGLAVQSGSITFPSMPAGLVRAVGVMDAASGGNMLYHGRLAREVNLVAGQSFTLNNNDLKILID
jgi:hypothetical protein